MMVEVHILCMIRRNTPRGREEERPEETKEEESQTRSEEDKRGKGSEREK